MFRPFNFTLLALTLFVAGCGINTGLDPVDDITNPRKTCAADFRVDNQSSQAIEMSLRMSELVMDARCSPDGSEDKKIIPAGGSDSIHLEIKCRTCMTNAFHEVRPGSGVGTLTVDRPGSEHLLCTDAGCTAVAN